MKDYPQDFDTPVFSSRRHLAVSRTFAIWYVVLLLAIIGLVGVFYWSAQSMITRPFLISIDNDTGGWFVIFEKNSNSREYTAVHAMQESVVGNFSRQWFTISQNNNENEARWCRCDQSSCARNNQEQGRIPCLVCCSSGPELFGRFTREVLMDYRDRVALGETWSLEEDTIHVYPVSEIDETGGLWHMTAVLNSKIMGVKRIEAYVRVSRSNAYYPLTMGFYVANFNAFLVTE